MQKRLEELAICDPNIALDKCVFEDDLTKWPKIHTGKIFAFILSCKDHEVDYVGKYKIQKAYSYFASNFVGKILLHKHDNRTILRGTVVHSYAINDMPHKVWICFQEDNVQGAWCTCIAGTAQSCNHIIAILYKVEYAIIMGYNDPACTSVSCNWNKSSQATITPKKVSEMDLRQDSRIANESNRNLNPQMKKDFDPRRQDQRQVTNEDVTSLYSRVHSAMPGAVLFRGLPHIQSPEEILSLMQIALETKEEYQNLDDIDLTAKYVENLTLKCVPQIVEKKTRKQAENPLWLEQREGRLTASNHHEIYTKVNTILRSKKTQKTTPLVAKILGKGRDLSHLHPIQWGRESENKAKEKFIQMEFLKHRSFTVKESGLVIHPQFPYVAASPDGICVCKCCPDMVLEIKCPYSIRDKTIDDGWKTTDFLEKVDKIMLKRSHKYYTQVQAQLALTKCKKGYFVVWTTVGDPLIETVAFDNDHWRKVLHNLTIFFKSHVVKHLLGFEELHYCPMCDNFCLPLPEIQAKKEENVFCTTCEQYYHLQCLDVTTVEKSDNYVCPGCEDI